MSRSNILSIVNHKTESRKSVIATLEDALHRAQSRAYDGLAIVMVRDDGFVESGYVKGDAFFPTLGGLAALQSDMTADAREVDE